MLTRSLDPLSKDTYYPFWSYDLFVMSSPSVIQRIVLKVYQVNEKTYPEGIDFFKLFPTVDFFSLSPAILIAQLGTAIQKNDPVKIQSTQEALARFTFAKRGRIVYSVVECKANSLKMFKTGRCDSELELGRFESSAP